MFHHNFVAAKALVTSREATRKILKGAKEILPEEGSYNKHYADISKGFKKYIKEGGRKQAYKDLSEFKGAHTHVYPIPDGVRKKMQSPCLMAACIKQFVHRLFLRSEKIEYKRI